MTYKQPTEEQFRNIMDNYWTMMLELEAVAHNDNDTILKQRVEAYFKQWNNVAGYSNNLVPVWKEGK